MKQLFLILAILSFSMSFSQELVLKKKNIYQDEKKLSNSEIKEKLSTDVESYQLYKTAKNKGTFGGFVLGFGIGFVLTDAIVGSYAYKYKYPSTPTFIGLGAVVVSIPILSGRKKLVQKSISTYNSKNKVNNDNTENNIGMNLINNNNGFGIQIQF